MHLSDMNDWDLTDWGKQRADAGYDNPLPLSILLLWGNVEWSMVCGGCCSGQE